MTVSVLGAKFDHIVFDAFIAYTVDHTVDCTADQTVTIIHAVSSPSAQREVRVFQSAAEPATMGMMSRTVL